MERVPLHEQDCPAEGEAPALRPPVSYLAAPLVAPPRGEGRHRVLVRAAVAIQVALAEAAAIVALVTMLFPVRPGVVAAAPPPPEVVSVGLLLLATPPLGGLVAVRRPANPVGWLFLQYGLWLAVQFATDGYARHAPPSGTTGAIVTVGAGLSGLWFSAFFLLLMVFPTGRLPGPRWRLLPGLVALEAILLTFYGLFTTDPQLTPPVADLPMPLARPDWQIATALANGIGGALVLTLLVLCVALLSVRFRRSRGVEREQLKWFAWAGAVSLTLMFLSVPSRLFGQALSDASWAIAMGSLVLLPAATAIAILRHRLFDIDLLINRTLVYLALSVVLALAYAVSVLLLTQLLAPIVPGNSIAVAGSTLLVAALFQPARRRIQDAVDHRFYRRRYSAAREIAAFGGRLRDEVDVDRVQDLLAGTVEWTVQPTFAAVWLREAGE